MGWSVTNEATRIMKTALNHTRNIQSKDFERMPYPWWVAAETKIEAIAMVEGMVHEALDQRRSWRRSDSEFQKLEAMYSFPGDAAALEPDYGIDPTHRVPEGD